MTMFVSVLFIQNYEYFRTNVNLTLKVSGGP